MVFCASVPGIPQFNSIDNKFTRRQTYDSSVSEMRLFTPAMMSTRHESISICQYDNDPSCLVLNSRGLISQTLPSSPSRKPPTCIFRGRSRPFCFPAHSSRYVKACKPSIRQAPSHLT